MDNIETIISPEAIQERSQKFCKALIERYQIEKGESLAYENAFSIWMFHELAAIYKIVKEVNEI